MWHAQRSHPVQGPTSGTSAPASARGGASGDDSIWDGDASMSTNVEPRAGRAPDTQPARRGERRARKKEHLAAEATRARRLALLRWAGLAALAVAVVAGAYAWLSPGPGPTARPVVGDDLHSLVVDPSNPERVLVGGHEGGALSEDGGRTWQPIAGLKGADPMGWTVDPRDPLKMYVGGHPGFYRSQDGGKSWSKDTGGLPGTDVHGLGIDPSDPNVLYAYVMGRGIYRSADAGRRWEPVNSEKNVMGPILVDPRQSGTLYLADARGGFEQSTDGGKTWQPLGAIPGGMAMWIAQDQQAPATFYAANGRALKSTDGGRSWQPTGDGINGSVSSVAVAPSDSRVVYAAVLEGGAARVFRSEDGGQTWQARN